MATTEIKSAPALITGGYQARIASVWQRHRSLGLTILSLVLGFAGWQILSTFFLNPFLVPPPGKVIKAAIPMILSGEILRDVLISLSRVFVGFIAGSVTAILLGVIIGRITIIHDLIDPIIELLRYLSPTAMIPIAVIWFGIGEMSKYFLIFWGTFFIMLVNTTAGVMRTPIARQRAAQCLGASQLEIFAYIVVPSAVPYIVTGMRVAMASAFMSIIPAEILAADSGIGYLLQNSSMLLQTDRMFVALLTISVLGFVCDRALRLIVELTLARFMVVN
jgi:ABC-type nitrate/sulfonate/bicarbonate transport system permease component